MSEILFDAPGPRTRARHRLYTIVTVLVILALVGAAAWLLWREGELESELWEPFVTPAYMQVIGEGFLDTLQMAFSSIVLAVVFGLVFGTAKLSEHAWLRWPATLVVEFFRAVPLLLMIIFIFLTYGTGDGIGSYWSVVIGLTLYNGSVLAEVFRAGIQAVPSGQAEAAYAIGMRKTQVMTLILIPQGVKIMLPAIISQCVVALKDTSLGYAVLAPGLTYVGRSVWTEFGNQFQTVVVLAALYILANLVLTWVAHLLQRKLVGEKRAPLEIARPGVHGDDIAP